MEAIRRDRLAAESSLESFLQDTSASMRAKVLGTQKFAFVVTAPPGSFEPDVDARYDATV